MHHERAPKSLAPAQPKGPENFQDPEPLFHAVFYGDDRPGRVLVDKLGHIEDDKVQTGTPVEKPYPFIGAFGEVRGLQLHLHSLCSIVNLLLTDWLHL